MSERERVVPTELEQELLAALRGLLSVEWADQCQECGIGKSDAWKTALAVVAKTEER